MKRRFEIATVLCFTATLSAGCTFGLLAPRERASNDGAGVVVATANGTMAEQSERLT